MNIKSCKAIRTTADYIMGKNVNKNGITKMSSEAVKDDEVIKNTNSNAIKKPSKVKPSEKMNDKNLIYVKLKDDSKTEIRYIYHISDIHIRNTQRHDEYKEIFIKTYQMLKSHIGQDNQISLIVITGDVMHSKTELSPEAIHIAYHFFKKLSKIVPIILIPGNHDCNLSNRDRLDALTPIVEDIGKLDKLFYLRKSGIYQYYNIMFGVTSILDDIFITSNKIEPEMFKKIKQKNRYKIALYHGIVHRASTDVGYRMNTYQILVDDFKGYDYVMLGDIHRFQYMNDSKTIAYAGSLIQQSHGESLDNHGILKWDLMSGQSELLKIKNSYGYCTIRIINGKIEETQIPKKPRIRFIIENTNQVQFQEIVNELEKKYQICEIVKETNIVSKVLHGLPICIDNDNDNLSVYSTQVDMMHNYLKNMGIEKDKINAIIELHHKIYQKNIKKHGKIVDDIPKTVGNQRWKILRLKFSNTLSYGKGNIIDFRKYDLNKIIGVVAPNHYGKSAILDIILFCLFDKFSRGDRRDILNKNEKNLYCSILLEIGNNKYLIERIGERNGLSVKIDVNLYLVKTDNGKKCKIKLNGVDKNETNRKIVELIGSYHDYVTTCFCLQNSKMSNFIDMTQTQKKEYLCEILKLNIFEKCYDIANSKLKKIMAHLKFLEQKICVESLDEFKNRIETISNNLKTLELQKKICDELLLGINRNIEIYSKYQPIKYEELTKFDKNEMAILTSIQEIEEKIEKQKYRNLKYDLDNLEKKRRELEEDIISYVEGKNGTQKLESKKEKLLRQIINIPNSVNFSQEHLMEEIILAEKRINMIDELLNKYNHYVISTKNDRINKLRNIRSVLRQELKPINLKIIDVEKEMIYLDNQRLQNEHVLFSTVDDILHMTLYGKDARQIKGMIDAKKEFVIYITKIIEKLNHYQMGISMKNDLIIDSIKSKLTGIFDKYYNWLIYASKELSNLKSDPDFLINRSQILFKQIIDVSYNLFDICENNIILSRIRKIESELDALSEFSGAKHEVDNLLKEKEMICEKIIIYNEKINELVNYRKQMAINEKVKEKLDKIQKKIEIQNEKYVGNINELKITKEKINFIRNEVDKYEMYRRNLKTLEKYHLICLNKYMTDKYLERWIKNRKNIEEKLVEIARNIEKNKIDLAIRTKDFKQYLEYRKHYDNLISKANIYSLYIQTINSNGLPYDMLKFYLPIIETNVNQILHSITNFSIEIMFRDDCRNINGKNKHSKLNNGYIDINISYHHIKPYNIQLASGFEKFIIGLAIRMSLGHISMITKPNFLIIDEGWSCLDSENLNNIGVIMDYIRTQYEHVIIISHLEELKNQSDYIINIEKEKGYSYINNERKLLKK
jgi:DNA repair exonuclease SbcCD ATPase subunit